MKRISVAINEETLSQLNWMFEKLKCSQSLLICYLIDTYFDYLATEDITYDHCRLQIEKTDFKWKGREEVDKKKSD